MKRQFLIIVSVLILTILACIGSDNPTESQKSTTEAENATTEALITTAIAKDATTEAQENATVEADIEAENATAEAERRETAEAEFYFATETPASATSTPNETNPITNTLSPPDAPPISVTPTCTGTKTIPISQTLLFPVPPNANLQQADDGSITIAFSVEDQNAFDTWSEFINDNFLTNSTFSYSTDASGKNFDWKIGLFFPPDTQMTPLADGQTEFRYSPMPQEDIPADDTAIMLPDIIEMPLPPDGTEPQYLDDGQVVINFSVNDKTEFDGWVEFMQENHIIGGTSYDDPFTEGTLGFNFPEGTTIEISDTAWIITLPR